MNLVSELPTDSNNPEWPKMDWSCPWWPTSAAGVWLVRFFIGGSEFSPAGEHQRRLITVRRVID